MDTKQPAALGQTLAVFDKDLTTRRRVRPLKDIGRVQPVKRPSMGVMPEFLLQTLSGPIPNESATRVVPWKQMCEELAALGVSVDGTKAKEPSK
jgi:hypothetical protein